MPCKSGNSTSSGTKHGDSQKLKDEDNMSIHPSSSLAVHGAVEALHSNVF